MEASGDKRLQVCGRRLPDIAVARASGAPLCNGGHAASASVISLGIKASESSGVSDNLLVRLALIPMSTGNFSWPPGAWVQGFGTTLSIAVIPIVAVEICETSDGRQGQASFSSTSKRTPARSASHQQGRCDRSEATPIPGGYPTLSRLASGERVLGTSLHPRVCRRREDDLVVGTIVERHGQVLPTMPEPLSAPCTDDGPS
jgi:hypothetical protein